MAASWSLEEETPPWNQNASNVHSGLPAGSRNRSTQGALPRTRSRSSAGTQIQGARQVLATLAAVSAVIFLAYMCSLFIRRRIAGTPFGRKLAAGAGGEGSDESEWCISEEEEVPDGRPEYPHMQHIQSPGVTGEVAQTKSEALVLLERITASAGHVSVSATRVQLATANDKRGRKRKRKTRESVDEETKKLIVEPPFEGTPPEAASPFQNPSTQSSGDSSSPGVLDPFTEETWLLEKVPRGLQPPPGRREHELFTQEHIEQPTDYSPPQTGPAYPGLTEDVSTQEEAPLDLSLPSRSRARLVAQPASSTQSQQTVQIQSFTESVSITQMGVSVTPLSMPGSSREPEPAAASDEKLPAATSASQTDPTIFTTPSISQALSLKELLERNVQLSSPAAGPSQSHEHGVAESAAPVSTLRGLLVPIPGMSATQPNARPTTVVPPHMLDLYRRAEAATYEIWAVFNWIGKMFRGIPDEILQTHPFCRLSGVQLRFSKRVFCDESAEWFSRTTQKAVLLLAESCRLLKKPALTSSEFDALMIKMERLVGYARSLEEPHITPKNAAETFGRAFMILDTLHCSAEVLGESSKKQEWWPSVIRFIKDVGNQWHPRRKNYGGTSWRFPIARALEVALDFYRLGYRPPWKLVLSLKLALLLSPKSAEFSNPKWNSWREDAANWLHHVTIRAQAAIDAQAPQGAAKGPADPQQ